MYIPSSQDRTCIVRGCAAEGTACTKGRRGGESMRVYRLAKILVLEYSVSWEEAGDGYAEIVWCNLRNAKEFGL